MRLGALGPLAVFAWTMGALNAVALGGGPQPQTQPRPQPQTQPTGIITGVVVIADSGLPLDGVRVTLSGAEIRGSRRAQTDDDGRFAFAGLPGGRYTLSASRTGYVGVTYGQREPGAGRAGTPIQLVQGQTIGDIRLPIPKGGVITGLVFDEKGRPSVGTPVRVSRWVMTTGERRLASAGSSSTDDRGMYRAYGLAPGSYIVHAIPRNPTSELYTAEAFEALRQAQAAGVSGINVSADGTWITVGSDVNLPAGAGQEAARVGYAPVYYPGTLDLAVAQTIELGVSEERVGVDLHLQQVPLTTVSGQLLIPPGVNMSNVRVRLVDARLNAPGISTPSTRAGRDGTFTFNAVAPGQYRAFAVASVRNLPANVVGGALGGEPLPPGGNTVQFWAAADVPVASQEITGITLVMQPGVIVSGQVLFDGFGQPRPTDLRRVRLTLAPGADGSENGVSSVSTNLDADGRFRFVGVVPGQYRIRAGGSVSGWWPKSALAAGRDALDFMLDVPERESVPNVLFTLADRSAELSGRIEDALSRPVADFTVILFPSDTRYWVPMSRRIASTRPATDGRFIFGGLPAGDYKLAAVTDAEPGAWYDPEFLRQLVGASVAVSLGEGEQRVQNLRVAGR